METQKINLPIVNRNTLMVAALAGAVYLVCEIILGTMDIAWFAGERKWGFEMNAVYTSLTAVMVISFALFARGFIALSAIFENPLLKVSAYMLIVAVAGKGILDATTLFMEDPDTLWLAYVAASIIFGALSIVFGISLIQLQDSMGELSRVAGMLEIAMGFLLVTVVLFFISYVILVPTVIVEIVVLYRGYEYLSRLGSSQVASA